MAGFPVSSSCSVMRVEHYSAPYRQAELLVESIVVFPDPDSCSGHARFVVPVRVTQ